MGTLLPLMMGDDGGDYYDYDYDYDYDFDIYEYYAEYYLQDDGCSDGDPSDELALDIMCAAKPNGEYCMLGIMEDMAQAEQAGGTADILPVSMIEFMCGDCFSKLGKGGSVNVLEELMFASDCSRRDGGADDMVNLIVTMMCLRGPNGYCIADPEAAVLLSDNSDSFFEALMDDDPAVTAAQRTDAATTFCENPCVNSFTNLAMAAAFPGGMECVPPEDQWPFRLLSAGCFDNGGRYCIDTVVSTMDAGMDVNMACGVLENFTWTSPGCSADCRANATHIVNTWGCCLTQLGLPINTQFDQLCSVALPSNCDFAGEFTVVIVVSNLRYAWLSERLADGLIRDAISSDVAAALNIGKTLVVIVSARASGSGTELTLTVTVPSAAMARSVAKRLAGTGRRAIALNVPMTTLDQAIPTAQRAAALVDPDASLAGGVQQDQIQVTGAVATEAFAAETAAPPTTDGSAAAHILPAILSTLAMATAVLLAAGV